MKNISQHKHRHFLKRGVFSLLLLSLVGCAHQPEGAEGRPNNGVFMDAARADAAYAQGHWVEAERHYRLVISKAPTDAHAWYRLGNVQLQQGRYAAAIEAYQAALVREPSRTKAYYNLSTVYLLQAKEILDNSQGRGNRQQKQKIALRQTELEGMLYAIEESSQPVAQVGQATEAVQQEAVPPETAQPDSVQSDTVEPEAVPKVRAYTAQRSLYPESSGK